MIMDIYRRLYKYRETPSLSPRENFLTEALADIFNRLPREKRIEFPPINQSPRQAVHRRSF
jgi:hypothetical protein